MRRRTAHALFGSAALACAAAATLQYAELRELRAVEAAALRPGDADVPGAHAPRARLARALAASRERDLDAAEPMLVALASGSSEGAPDGSDASVGSDALVAIDARFALANAYLREGLRPEADPARARAFLELAKQRYRDALLIAPDDMDARYNLERALRAAPEGGDDASGDAWDPVKSVDAIFPDFAPTDLP